MVIWCAGRMDSGPAPSVHPGMTSKWRRCATQHHPVLLHSNGLHRLKQTIADDHENSADVQLGHLQCDQQRTRRKPAMIFQHFPLYARLKPKTNNEDRQEGADQQSFRPFHAPLNSLYSRACLPSAFSYTLMTDVESSWPNPMPRASRIRFSTCGATMPGTPCSVARSTARPRSL